MNADIDLLSARIKKISKVKKWDKDWSRGGCYITLEVSEFIESLRGKGNTSPIEEGADVLFTLFAVMENYDIKPSEVLKQLDKIVLEMEAKEGLLLPE